MLSVVPSLGCSCQLRDFDFDVSCCADSVTLQHGGHCAFVVGDKDENEKGWLATELARFGEHVASHRTDEEQSP